MNNDLCSIYQALQLKEFLVPQKSKFFYENLTSKVTYGRGSDSLCAAFQATELLTLIPNPIEKDGYTYTLTIIVLNTYQVQIHGNQVDGDELMFECKDKNLQDALAKALIFLLENDFLDFDS